MKTTLPDRAAADLPASVPRAAAASVPLIAGFVLLLGVAVAGASLYLTSARVNERLTRALEIRSAANRLFSAVQDAETGQRGYLLTGNRDYLQPYLRGSADVPRALAELKAKLAGREAQLAIVADLEPLLPAKLAELASTIERADRHDMAGALAIVENNTGNTLMARIRDDIARIRTSEIEAAAGRRARANASAGALTLTALASIVVICALASYAIVQARRRIGDLVRARAELRHINQNLEAIIDSRVADLRLANEEIQRFAYIVSHDLRAPLVNVLGFTSELDTVRSTVGALFGEVQRTAPHLATPGRRAAIETDLPEALGFIRTSTVKMDRLISAILKLSRDGRRRLAPQPVDVAALIEEQAASLSKRLLDRGTSLVIEPGLPSLVSDKLALEQIFGNLIENAVKYLAPGRPGRIAVSGERRGSFVRYEVADNGRGIEAKDFERVFELFRRSGVQDTPGEGIGLAFVRNLVRRLGGTVSVRSQLGVGSTFTVTLPAVLAEEAQG